jgi:hypothetical protein
LCDKSAAVVPAHCRPEAENTPPIRPGDVISQCGIA